MYVRTGHALNEPLQLDQDNQALDTQAGLGEHGEGMAERLEASLASNDDFVRIAGDALARPLP